MKKILVVLTIVLMAFSSLNANRNHALNHANPMPNLMRIALGNAELLDISKTQLQSLKEWGKTNKPVMKQMIKQVMEQERTLRRNSLNSDDNINKLTNDMLKTRKDIIIMKTKCRRNLKKILNAKQYKQVIGIYRSNR